MSQKTLLTGLVIFTFLVGMGLATNALAAPKAKNPATFTCQDLVDVDIDYIPHVVYWIDGYNWAGEPNVDVGLDWFAVPVDDIVTECEQNPKQPAANVIKKHSMQHNKKTM